MSGSADGERAGDLQYDLPAQGLGRIQSFSPASRKTFPIRTLSLCAVVRGTSRPPLATSKTVTKQEIQVFSCEPRLTFQDTCVPKTTTRISGNNRARSGRYQALIRPVPA